MLLTLMKSFKEKSVSQASSFTHLFLYKHKNDAIKKSCFFSVCSRNDNAASPSSPSLSLFRGDIMFSTAQLKKGTVLK